MHKVKIKKILKNKNAIKKKKINKIIKRTKH